MEEGGLRDQFRLQKLKLTWDDQEDFGSTQWRWPRPIFVIYRLVAASYVIGWNVYGYVTIPTFGSHVTIVFYTNWSYLVLGLHLTLALLITIFHSARRKDIRSASNPQQICEQRNGNHVITTWFQGGAPPCGTQETTAAYPPPQECQKKKTAATGGKRKQKVLKYNNNEYKTDDNHRKRHLVEATSTGCNGVTNVKRRSKVKDHGEQSKGSEGDAQGPTRQKSVGVLCAGISASQPAEGALKRVINEGRNRSRRPECDGADDNVKHAHTTASRKASTEAGTVAAGVEGRTGHKVQGHGAHHMDTSRPTHPDQQQRASERKQRRRRHVKVCHRGGRAVGFKYKSSNSSLDKIRSKGRRLTSGGKRRRSRSPHGGVDGRVSLSGSGTHNHAVALHALQGNSESAQIDANDLNEVRLEEINDGHKKHRRLQSKARGSSVIPRDRHKPRVCSTALPYTPDELEFYRNLRSKHRKHTIILHPDRSEKTLVNPVGNGENVTVVQPRMRESKPGRAKHKVRNSLVKSEETENVKNTRSIGTNTSLVGAPLPPSISYIEATSRRSTAPQSLPFFVKMSWLFYNIAVVSAFVVSAVYFFILFPMLKREEPNYQPGILDINLHGINSLIVFLEISLSAIPVRILHFVYPVAYGITYVVFSIAYWALDRDNNILYPVILDWNQPGIATAIVIGIVLVATPLCQCFIYALYRLRLYIYHRIYNVDISSNVNGRTSRRETEV